MMKSDFWGETLYKFFSIQLIYSIFSVISFPWKTLLCFFFFLFSLVFISSEFSLLFFFISFPFLSFQGASTIESNFKANPVFVMNHYSRQNSFFFEVSKTNSSHLHKFSNSLKLLYHEKWTRLKSKPPIRLPTSISFIFPRSHSALPTVSYEV